MDRTKLAKVNKIPDQFVLLSLVEMATMIRSALICLPFQAGERVLVVTCTFSFATTNVPRWTLCAGEADDAPLAWTRDSADLEEVAGWLAQGVLAQVERRATPQNTGLPEPAVFDQVSFDNFCKRLIDSSGMFAEGSFYWFLMQEFNRYQRTKLGFGIVLLSPCASTTDAATLTRSRAEVVGWLGNLAVAEVRKLDYVCQFNGLIGMVLANSTLEESETCAQRIIELAHVRNKSQRYESGFDPHAGVSGIPQTCEHPGILIAAAQQSLQQSISERIAVKAFR